MKGPDWIKKNADKYECPKVRRLLIDALNQQEQGSQKDDASKGDIKIVFLDWENANDKEDYRDRRYYDREAFTIFKIPEHQRPFDLTLIVSQARPETQ